MDERRPEADDDHPVDDAEANQVEADNPSEELTLETVDPDNPPA
jgi:hypothetical protein